MSKIHIWVGHYTQHVKKVNSVIISGGTDLGINMLNQCVEHYQCIYGSELNVEILQAGLLLDREEKVSKSKISLKIFKDIDKVIGPKLIAYVLRNNIHDDINFNLMDMSRSNNGQ